MVLPVPTSRVWVIVGHESEYGKKIPRGLPVPITRTSINIIITNDTDGIL
jgi:hypothetical protein